MVGALAGWSGARAALKPLNTIKPETGLPLLSRGHNPGNAIGWWSALPLGE